MSSQQDSDRSGSSSAAVGPFWRKFLKITAITIVAIVLLLIAGIGGAVYYLNPGRLTPMVEKLASKYLDGDVKVERIELSFWSCFPRLKVDLQNLKVVSHALDGLNEATRASLPADADTLMTLDRLRGGVNLPALLTRRIALSDVELSRPALNLVSVNDTVANYLIFDSLMHGHKLTGVPDISVNRFTLPEGMPVRYRNIATGTDLTLSLSSSSVSGADQPVYLLSVLGSGGGAVTPAYHLEQLPFGIDGKILWSPSEPQQLGVENMMVKLDALTAEINGRVELADTIRLHKLEVEAHRLDVASALELLPDSMRQLFDGLHTDLQVKVKAKLTEPYSLANGSWPGASVDVTADGSVNYERLNLQNVNLDLNVRIDGTDPDRSVLNLRRLEVRGEGADLRVAGLLVSPVTSPRVQGTVDGSLDLRRLPSALVRKANMHPSGTIGGHADFRFRLADLTPEQFHHIWAGGSMKLDDIDILSLSDGSRIRFAHAVADLGTDMRYDVDSTPTDSMLSIRFGSDRVAVYGGGISCQGTGFKLAVGVHNTAESAENNVISPLYGSFTADRIALSAPDAGDSLKVSLQDVSADMIFRRRPAARNKPAVDLNFDAGTVSCRAGREMAVLSGVRAGLQLEPSSGRYASVAAAASPARVRNSDAGVAVDTSRQYISLAIQRPVLQAMRRTSLRGTLSARGGWVRTPSFPLNTRLNGLDMRFTADSVALDRLDLSVGRSDITAGGYIAGIVSALTDPAGSPFRVRFNISSDTMDINQMAEAVFRGAALRKMNTDFDSVSVASLDHVSDSLVAAARTSSPQTLKAAPLIPSNVDGQFDITADNVLYSDIWIQRLDGKARIRNGAVHLDRIAGYTPMGTIDLTALYTAPDERNLSMAAGLVVRDLQIHKFLHMMPQIDSLLPLLNDVSGIITTQMAMTTELEPNLDLKFHTLKAMIRLSGDGLALKDNKTFHTVAKLLRFQDKNRLMIDHMDVEIALRNSLLEVYPFLFDIDRYRIGVSGRNDLNMNLDYHISILKSPIPFKFGINIHGRPHHLHFSLGGAKYTDRKTWDCHNLTDTVRVNLIDEIRDVFSFGVRSGRANARLEMRQPPSPEEFTVADTLTQADSLFFIKEGILPLPPELTPGTR